MPAMLLLQMSFIRSSDWSNPDHVQYGTRGVIGAPGSYNHLTDAAACCCPVCVPAALQMPAALWEYGPSISVVLYCIAWQQTL
jgi:hypothetical protein